jgi:GT2 family glycosyltransferase
MTGEPRIAVLVPVHGALPLLVECLESLASVATTTAYNVTIVDDATPGGLATWSGATRSILY